MALQNFANWQTSQFAIRKIVFGKAKTVISSGASPCHPAERVESPCGTSCGIGGIDPRNPLNCEVVGGINVTTTCYK